MNPKSIKRLIALELGGKRVVAAELTRSGSRVEVKRRFQAPLTLDPFSADPELSGRELANALAQGGFKSAWCIVSLPVSQVLVHQIDVPAIEDADLKEFLNLEVERVFPFAADDMMVGTSFFADAAGARRATLAAVSLNHVAALEKVLRGAKLKPVSFTVGTAALAETTAAGKGARAAIVRNEAGIELAVWAGGGLMTLRPLSEPGAMGDREDAFDAASIVRECRITLGRLPRPIRDAIGKIDIFGTPAAQQALLKALSVEMESIGIALGAACVDDHAQIGPGDRAQNPAGAVVAGSRWLTGGKSSMEFLPPKVSRIKLLAKQWFGQAKVWKFATVAALIVFGAGGAFGWQYWKLSELNGRWDAIKADVARLDALQAKIRTYGPWFDDTAPSLQIALALTEAFPPQGNTIWMKTVNIKGQADIACTGVAGNRAEIQGVLDRLGKIPGVVDPQPGRISNAGQNVQFNMTYKWSQRAYDAGLRAAAAKEAADAK